MTETPSDKPALSTMRLAELQQLASSMGLKGTSRMRKSELVAAIRGEGSDAARSPARSSSSEAPAQQDAAATAAERSADQQEAPRSRRRRATAQAGAPEHHDAERADAAPREERQEGSAESHDDAVREERSSRRSRRERGERGQDAQRNQDSDGQREGSRRGRRRAEAESGEAATRRYDRDDQAPDSPEDHLDAKAALMRDLADATGTAAVEPSERKRRDRDRDRNHGNGNNGNDDRSNRDSETDSWADEGRGGRRRRGRKRRDRDRDRNNNGNGSNGNDQNDSGQGRGNRDDDVLLPVAGILDVADKQHAYLRTSGYLPGAKDVYVNAQQMKDAGLRPGDAITGWVREGGETANPGGNQGGRSGRRQNRQNRQKYNPLVSIETVNGMDPERSKRRPEFTKLTPLYPQEQLRLETTPKALTPRVIDLVAPIGKGQRGLIVSPPKAGKTIVLQQIANAISVNNPEAHLMVVLVDERPEEVTDMQRTVKGEVIASTFDRPASDHTTVAELAIERAKRLVELGQDVVVLLDSITRLGRAYNLAAPASGRILSGGVDASALYPPKRFFGAARNIENGGSLTILATALVETGSKMDEVIFEEFKGTGNMELRLSRQLAEKRIFPAVDVAASSTRREELLINPAQLKIMWRLRRLFAGLDQQAALELVIGKLKETQSNAEFLMTISRTTPEGTSLADADDGANLA
ncbi:transcription termination factor Rho [Actinomyces radicidentis]|uniref:transcription termination factor Rho n=1 Tax=Actinomyces radicidentis TaxID=111015 RepID=UPI0026E09489|nr:transcription termination factor Rho [Actinomyces radicidentis]